MIYGPLRDFIFELNRSFIITIIFDNPATYYGFSREQDILEFLYKICNI